MSAASRAARGASRYAHQHWASAPSRPCVTDERALAWPGCSVRPAHGFDLALVPAGVLPEQPHLHFGFRCADAAEVHTLLRHVTDHGISVVERVTGTTFSSFKCLDPDGYQVEAYWDGTQQ